MLSVSDLQSRAPAAPALRRPLGTAAAAADELFERRKPGLARRLSAPERRTEAVAAAGFVVGAAVLARALPRHAEHPTSVGLLVLAYALVRRVRFQFGTGLIRPTQLVFVPMVFLTPAPWVPALVGAGALLGELPDVLSRRAHPERLLVCVADGWYAFGPALVVVGLDPAVGTPAAAAALVCVLAAQFTTDFAASSLREWFGARVHPRELWPVLALVYLVDTLLTPLGYLAVLAGRTYEYAYLLAIAPAAVLGLLAGERSGRITRELELERAFRRSARALDARTQELRRRAERLQGGDRRMGEAVRPPVDPARLEPLLLSTVMDVVRADCGRLRPPAGHASQPPVVISRI